MTKTERQRRKRLFDPVDCRYIDTNTERANVAYWLSQAATRRRWAQTAVSHESRLLWIESARECLARARFNQLATR